MSETDNQADNAEPSELQKEELRLLKQRATMMGITFSNNIGLDSLKAKIEAKMSGVEVKTETVEPQANPLEEQKAVGAQATVKSLRQRIYDKNMHLVRLRIQNLDPKKKDLPGEIFTVANEVLGTVSKFIPYNEVSEGGYHVPFCIYKLLRNRQFQNITITKNARTGKEQVRNTLAKEFALEVLPPLTPQQLKQLAQAQLAAGSMDAS
jgi:hypothetical protein